MEVGSFGGIAYEAVRFYVVDGRDIFAARVVR